MISHIMAFLKELFLAFWNAIDTQATIKYFFEALRNLMVTATIGFAAKISGSDTLHLIYSAALFLLGWQVSMVILNRIEMFSKPHLSPVWLTLLFYLFTAFPISIRANLYIQEITNAIVDVQSGLRKNEKNLISSEICKFTIDLDKFGCPTETGVSRP